MESLTYKGKHYLFTVQRYTSTFEVYVLDSESVITTQTFSFEEVDFGEGRRTVPNLDRLLQGSFSREAAIIDSESPIALESSKSDVTFYQEEALVTQDRASRVAIDVATLGRLSKSDLERLISNRIKEGTTLLCSDSHHSYKGFAKNNAIEFHPINTSKKKRVDGIYHIQHVNATHNKMKNG